MCMCGVWVCGVCVVCGVNVVWVGVSGGESGMRGVDGVRGVYVCVFGRGGGGALCLGLQVLVVLLCPPRVSPCYSPGCCAWMSWTS